MDCSSLLGNSFQDKRPSDRPFSYSSKSNDNAEHQAMLVAEFRATRSSRIFRHLMKTVDGLALKEHRRVAWARMDKQDVQQTAAEGLLKAIDRWDPARGPFSACAFVWIRAAFTEAARTYNPAPASIGKGIKERRLHLHVAHIYNRAIAAGMSESEAVAYAAEYLGVSHDHLRKALMLRQSHARAGASGAGEANIPDAAPPVEELVQREQVSDAVAAALASLNADNRAVMYARFEEERSLTDIGSSLGINRERIRKKVNSAVSIVAAHLLEHGITAEDVV